MIVCGIYHLLDQPFHRLISFIKYVRHKLRISVQAQSQLRQIVRPYAETIKYVGECLGQNHI